MTAAPVNSSTALPPLEPRACHELRVHGVAGTSPESMLGLKAELTGVDVPTTQDGCTDTTRPGDISVWRTPEVQPDLRAWSWSSLTSGHWYQAFYLVLLPFMIANVAGWMLVSDRHATAVEPTEESTEFRTAVLRASTALVRLVGLLVTVVFVLAIQLVLADVVVWQWLYRRVLDAHWVVGVGPVATAVVLALLVGVTRIRQPIQQQSAWTDHRDPVGIGFLQRRQYLLWNSPGINVTLRRLHLTGGLATIALLAAWPADPLTAPWSAVRTTAFALAIVTGVVVVAIMAWISLGDSTTGLRSLMWCVRYLVWPIPAVAVVLAALAPIGLTTDAAHSAATLPALRGATVWVTAAILVGVLLLYLIGRSAGGSPSAKKKAVNAPTLLLIAASIGAALGAGLASQTAHLIDGACTGAHCLIIGEQVNWLAIGVTVSLAVLVVVTTGRALRLAGAGSWSTVLARLTENGTWITTVLGVAGAVLALVGVGIAVLRPGGLPPAEDFPTWPALLIVAAIVVPVAGAILVVALRRAWSVPESDGSGRKRGPGRIRALRAARVAVIVIAVAVLAVAVIRHWTVPVLGVPLPPATFLDFATDIAVVLPTAVALTRIYSGLTNRTTRRGVGVLWDVGTFWPRWFHPFAPPTYSDRAVTQLDAQLHIDIDQNGHRLLLAPHSQGAIIAAAAVLLGPPRPRMAMLSYGSPWNRLYAEFFPTQVDADTTAALADRLRTDGTLRWINLYRVTDPVGGRIPTVPQNIPLADPCHRLHSDYWVEDQYAVSARQLRAMLPAPQPPG